MMHKVLLIPSQHFLTSLYNAKPTPCQNCINCSFLRTIKIKHFADNCLSVYWAILRLNMMHSTLTLYFKPQQWYKNHPSTSHLYLFCFDRRSLLNPRKVATWLTVLAPSVTWSAQPRPRKVWEKCSKWPQGQRCRSERGKRGVVA